MGAAMAESIAGAFQNRRPVQNASQARDFVQNPLGYFALIHFWKSEVAAIAGEKRYDICVLIEPRAFGSDVVGHDQVRIL